MKCLWCDTVSLTENTHVIMQKYVRYLLNKFTHNNYLVVSTFLWKELRLSNLTSSKHPAHLWNNLILIYLRKVIRILALLWHILILSLNFFLQKNDSSILVNHMGSRGWLHKELSLRIYCFSAIISCFRVLYCYWHSSMSTWTWKICGW